MSEVMCLCADDAKVECGNCGWTGVGEDLKLMSDFEERVAAGEVCPAGQCPECGALAHLVAEKAEAEALKLTTRWRPIATAPLDEWVLLATTGEWVGEAIFGEDAESPSWRWAGEKAPIHANYTPLGWQPLDAPIFEPAKAADSYKVRLI